MSTTCYCGRVFATVEALRSHATHFGHTIKCYCGAMVGSTNALKNHVRDVGHRHVSEQYEELDLTSQPTSTYKCDYCVSKRFDSASARDQHMAAKHHDCPYCYQVFNTRLARLRHQKASDHYYCAEHDEAFGGSADLAKHRRVDAHISSFECTNCDRSFGSEKALNDHLASDGHVRVIAEAANKVQEENSNATKLAQLEEAGLYCEACDRKFVHLRAFQQHKASLKHKPLSELRCPLSKDCPGTFSSPSALLFHLESGACRGGMTRNKLNAIVFQHDNDHHITSSEHTNRVLNITMSESSCASIAPNSSASNRVRSVSIDSSRSGMTGHALDTPYASETSSTLGPGVSHETLDASDCGSAVSFDDDSFVLMSASDATSTLGGGDSVLDTTASAASDTTSTLSGEGVILTPSSTSTISTNPIFTPSASVPSDGGVVPAPPGFLTSSALSDWSFLNSSPIMAHSPTSVAGSSVETLTFNPTLKRWTCHDCSQTFRKKHDLIQHMDSIVHSPKIFHCPASLPGLPGSGKPTIKFKTLSGMAQHIEAGSCKGGQATLGFIVGIFERQIEAKLGKSVKLLKD